MSRTDGGCGGLLPLMSRGKVTRKIVRDAAQAGVITGLILAILLLAGCAPEPLPVQVIDTFCEDSSPFPAAHAGGLDAAGKRWVFAHNCQGVKRCGWLPDLDPAVCEAPK